MSANCFNLDQSKILSSGNGLMCALSIFHEDVTFNNFNFEIRLIKGDNKIQVKQTYLVI